MNKLHEINGASDAVMRVFERHWPDDELPATLSAEVKTAIEICLSDAEDSTVSPSRLAENWGISVDKVLSWIRDGQLKAINVASSRSVRPRYRITDEAIGEFQQVREENAHAKVKIPRRKKKRVGDVIEFF